MSIGLIILILFILAISGLIIWFYRNKAKEKAEQEAKEKAEQEAKEKAEKEAKEKAEKEAKEKAEQEAKEKAEKEAKEKAEQEAKEKAEKEAKEKAEQEAKEKAEKEAKEKAEQEAKEKAEKKNNYFINALNNFKIKEEYILLYKYLNIIFNEAYAQYFESSSTLDIPLIIKEENFPNIYNFYGEDGDEDSAFNTFIGWLFALVLAELKPTDRTNILKIGYELGGYNRYSNIYGYKFEYDPNVLRISASALYCAMRGILKPDVENIRKEIGGSQFSLTLNSLKGSNKEKVGWDDFYIDFREFMPTAPGPYAQGYSYRSDRTYPNEGRDEFDNLLVDRKIYDMVVENYNLYNKENYQTVVQAIADKEAEATHLFGNNMKAGVYSFQPVFGIDSIGQYINPEGKIASMVIDALWTSSNSRRILQSKETNPKQYGRMRPGCSWEKEATKHSETEDKYNALCNFIIEDGDGNPTGYYNKNGNWTQPAVCKSAEEFEDMSKKQLWANSYPSGHSSGIAGGSAVLIELMPYKVNVILRRMNMFAINRTIARYHWTSDTINGRVLGFAQNAIAHAASNYDTLLEKCRKELNGVIENETIEVKNDNPGTFTFSFGGSECTVTANEAVKYAERKCHRYRSPIMVVSENVNYKIESPDGYDVSVNGPKGLTSGTFNANTNYVIYCAALEPGIEKMVKITLWNKSGTKIINYRCYSPNFEVNYKNSTSVSITNIKCNIVYDNGDKGKSNYEWTIGAGKEKSDSWIDNSHNNIKEISGLTMNGKTVKYDIIGLNTKEITITIK